MMILGYICIVIMSGFVLSGHADGQLRCLKINSFAAMLLLLIAAVVNSLPQGALERLGLDYLTMLLLSAGFYMAIRRGVKRLIPIFSGILAIMFMACAYNFATNQLGGSFINFFLFIIVMSFSVLVVSRSGELFITASIGIAVSQLIISLASVEWLSITIQPIGGVILAVILLGQLLTATLDKFTKMGKNSAIRRNS